MKKKILDKLAEIERQYDVKILLAAETGSRAWGFESGDSDWDVRFIYVHKLPWYLQVEQGRDVIEFMSDDRTLDFVGWDIRKTMGLFKDCNLTMLEWLHSPYLYTFDKEFTDRIKVLEKDYFLVKNGLYHYFNLTTSIAGRNIINSQCEMKPFLYYLRGLLACQWIERYHTAPLVPFDQLVDAVVDDKTVKDGINRYVGLKRKSKEYDRVCVEPQLMDYAAKLAAYYTDNIKDLATSDNWNSDTTAVDKLVLDMVLKYSDLTV